MVVEYILIPAGVAAVIYIVRKIREHKWGWVRSNSSLKDKIFIVTGANTGLGYETSRHLIRRDATVILACRDSVRAEEAIAKIRKETQNGQMIFLQLDLASFHSIKSFAGKIKSEYPNFDCLIENAGLAVTTKEYTKENYEIHFGVNHLGHFLLYQLLENNIRQNNARVVVVSSQLHESGVIDFDYLGKINDEYMTGRSNKLYANSKLCNFYFARELFKKGIDCHVLCPGLCHTDFFRNYNPRWYHYILFAPVVLWLLRSAEQGAQNIIHCATDNQNTEDQNPEKGYFIKSLKQTKSKVKFDNDISKKLWEESLKMCSS